MIRATLRHTLTALTLWCLVSLASGTLALSGSVTEGTTTDVSLAPHESQNPLHAGPLIVKSQFLAGEDVESLQGVWLAGLASGVDALPQVLSITWSQVPSGWFGTQWSIQITSAQDLLPPNLRPAAGAEFVEGIESVHLAYAEPRPGHRYETTLSYDPERGFMGVRLVDLTADQVMFERGFGLNSYNKSLVPSVGLELKPESPPVPTPSRFESLAHEPGFLPLGVGWDVLQRTSSDATWFRPQALDRRFETQVDVRLPWDTLPGRILVRVKSTELDELDVVEREGVEERELSQHGGEVLAEVQVHGRDLTLPIEIMRLPAGEHRLVLEYASEHGTWHLLEKRVNVGRLTLAFNNLEAIIIDGDEAPSAHVRGALLLESDGPISRATLRLHADLAVYDRDYWLTTGRDGTAQRGALHSETVAQDLTLIEDLEVDIASDDVLTAPFEAVLPIHGEEPPPGGGWTITLRSDVEASVSHSAPAIVQVWARRAPHALVSEDSQSHRSHELTVMVYNIRHGRGMDDVVDLERIADVIRGADIVGLNEVDRNTMRTGGIDQAATLARLLDMHVAYGANINFQGGLYGNAILSRFPITSAHNLALPSSGEQRGLLHVTLDVAGHEVHFLTTHLGLTSEEQEPQLRRVAQYITELADPLILGGDFNLEYGVDSALGSRLRDAWRLQQDEGRVRTPRGGATIPSTRPTRRIDYIFLSGDVHLRGDDPVRTVASTASDHLPVVAEITIER